MTSRLQSIDLLRGFALLGLPTMNIIVFSMPFSGYLNPVSYASDGALNDLVFSFFYLFADQKFMGIFSALFGASVLLLADKNQQAGKHAGRIHYSRTFWLIVIGFLHAWFLWEGDVLMYYGIMAIVLYPFKWFNVPVLAGATTILLSISAYMTHHGDISDEVFGTKQRAELSELYMPTKEQQQERQDLLLGSYAGTVSAIRDEFTAETMAEEEQPASGLKRLGISGLTKIWGMMCLGMLLYKIGIPQGLRSASFYRKVGITSLALGTTITAAGLVYNYSNAWNMDTYFRFGMTFKEVGSTFMVIGYMSLIVLAHQRGMISRLASWISPVGQMALTNYLMQSVICALIFYGYGLGLYGSVSRLELLPIIVGIWVFQIGFAGFWLSLFKQGPIEWIWRNLTYMRIQSIRKTRSTI